MRSRTAIGGSIIPVDGADIGVASCLENDHGRKLLLSTVEAPVIDLVKAAENVECMQIMDLVVRLKDVKN